MSSNRSLCILMLTQSQVALKYETSYDNLFQVGQPLATMAYVYEYIS